MGFITTLLILVEILTALLLIAVILMQQSKGQGGLGTAFGGGGMGESMFGSRAGNVLTKTTVVLAAVFLLNTMFLAVSFARKHDDSIIDERSMSMPAPPMGAPPARMMTEAPAAPAPVAADPGMIAVEDVAPFEMGDSEPVMLIEE